MKIIVTKTTGETEYFNKNKIVRTCTRAGAPDDIAKKIADKVERYVYNGIPTLKILKYTLTLLKKYNKSTSSRYDLKGSIFRLGPSGFPFEIFISELLKEYGYKTKVQQTIRGGSVKHEIDVIAEKENKIYPIECKYHNAPGIYTGIKDILYIYARFLDLNERNSFTQPWIATNTLFSRDTLTYANHKKIKLLSWSYPNNESISSLLEQKKLYPITILKSLTRNQISQLVSERILFCKSLLTTSILEKTLKLPSRKIKLIRTEAEHILGD